MISICKHELAINPRKFQTVYNLVFDDVSTDVVSAVIGRRQPRHTTRFPRHIRQLRHRGWSRPGPRVPSRHGGRCRGRVSQAGPRLGRDAELVGLTVEQARYSDAGPGDHRTHADPAGSRDETLFDVVANQRCSTVTGWRRPRHSTGVAGHLTHLDVEWR